MVVDYGTNFLLADYGICVLVEILTDNEEVLLKLSHTWNVICNEKVLLKFCHCN